MRTIFAIALALVAIAPAATPAPRDVYRLYATHEYDAAGAILEKLDASDYDVRLATGDHLLDKKGDYAGAEAIYQALLDEFPKDKRYPDVLYRLALAQELQERFLDAAQSYEIVATRHMKSRFGNDALDAIERCFRKNYQDRVAFVDGFPITRIELDDRIGRYPANYETFEKKEQLLDTMVENRLLYHAAVAAGIPAEDEFLTAYRDMRDRYVFEEWYAHHVTALAEPTEKELKAQYNKDKVAKFTTPEKAHGWQLVVARRELADSLRKVLLGVDAVPWETLAAGFSVAPDKDRGGDLGLFARGTRDKAVEDAAFRLKPGQVSQPVKLDTTWALVRVTERTKKTVKPYAEARNQLEVQVRQDKVNRIYEEKSAALKKAAAVMVDSNALDAGGDILGSVDGVPLTRAGLNKRLEQIPAFFRAQFETPEGMRRILDQMVLEQLILQDAEANGDWLWNNAVNRILERRGRMLVDRYVSLETVQKVTVDTAEVKADYQATISEFKVPAKVHAREIAARTRARAELLRRWAKSGRLPALIGGRALFIADPAMTDLAAALAATDSPDTLVANYGFTDVPRAVLPGTPTQRLGNRLVPDMGSRAKVAGPWGAEGAYGLVFADRSREDTLFLPSLIKVADAEALARLLGITPDRDSTGAALVDEGRLGTYVGFEDALTARDFGKLFSLDNGATAEPLTVKNGMLAIRLSQKDTATTATFEDIARRFSSAASRFSGGDMYWVTRDDKSKEKVLVDAAFDGSAGSISSIIKVNDSTYAFVKVEEKQKAYTQPLEEVMQKIEDKLRRQKTDDLHAQLVKDLRAAADIEVLMKPGDFIFEIPEEDTPPTGETGGSPQQ